MNEPKQTDHLMDAIKDGDPRKVAQYSTRESITELHVQTALDILADAKSQPHVQVGSTDATVEAIHKIPSENTTNKNKAASAQAIVSVLQEMASDAVLDAIDARHARKFQEQRDKGKNPGGTQR